MEVRSLRQVSCWAKIRVAFPLGDSGEESASLMFPASSFSLNSLGFDVYYLQRQQWLPKPLSCHLTWILTSLSPSSSFKDGVIQCNLSIKVRGLASVVPSSSLVPLATGPSRVKQLRCTAAGRGLRQLLSP